MADAPSSPATMEFNPQKSQDQNSTSQSNLPNPPPAPTPPPPSSQASQPTQSSPNPSPNSTQVPPTPPSISYAPPPVSGVAASFVPPSAPSFRPVPQFSPIPNFQNPSLQIPGVQPPGVSSAAASGGAAGVPISVPVPPQPLMHYQVQPGQFPNPALRPSYAPIPNGFTAVPGAVTQGTIPPPGLPRFPSPYTTMVRHAFSPRPPGAIGVLPRPPVPGIPGVRPIIPPIVRPVIPSVTPAEKPQTTVYVGKIAPTVENDFMLSVLQFCGPVKAWKRAQDPTDGTPRGFGFCEFESAEGVLRALRLLSKFSIDGQELVLNVNQATRDYLERYVEKKTENSKKLKATEASPAMKEDESAASDEKTDLPKPTAEEPTKEDSDSGNKENDNANFGIVTDEDSEADREAMGKLTSMIEERLKTKPLPPPPPPPPPPAQASGEGAGNSNSELPAKSRDGDSDADMRNDAAEEKNDDESTSGNKHVSENDRTEASSPDKNRRHDRRSRDRDRERDLKREKERELERFERETERERIRKEREQRRRLEEAERQYEEYLKEWEYREREKEKQRQYEKEREKDRERKRKKEIIYEEEDDDDDSRKRWRRSALEEKRKKRLREKEDDLVDMQKEEEEMAEAKRRAEEEKQRQQEKDLLESSSDRVTNGTEKAVLAEESSPEMKDKDYEGDSGHDNRIGDMILQNGGIIDESTMASVAASDTQHSGNVTTKKLGFGLVGSGKRTAVPSVFSNEDDDDAHKEKKMRPLVPIDYSTEELQAVQTASGATQPNLVAAAEFAKRISNTGSKDEKLDAEKERSRRTKDRYDEDGNRTRNETKEKTRDTTDREYGGDRVKTTNNKKLLDAKQLIDMIPKTKEELFSYEINWAVYDKHALHERMRPWISKKITEFLGEEEATLVDYIVSSTQEHVEADGMLQLLQSILDEEAEMFVLKMWRMLIFEIKKVETGLSSRSRT